MPGISEKHNSSFNPSLAKKSMARLAAVQCIYLTQLLQEWKEQQPAIEKTLDDNLLEGWTRNRMSPVMVAILCTAICERRLHPSLKTAIWIDEYVTIAGSFFSDQEVGFVNRLLENLANQ